MRILTESQYLLEAEPALRKVFVNDDPFGEVFSDDIKARRILYRCECSIEPRLMRAIIEAALSEGDTGFYASSLMRHPIQPDDIHHSFITLSEMSEQILTLPVVSEGIISVSLGIDIILEFVIYSPQSKWGLMISHERHGMLGGSINFIEVVHRNLPDLNDHIYRWLRFFQEEKAYHDRHKLYPLTLDWLPELLAHVYGLKEAEKMLRESGLP
jgi:hypothetical protein